jgi:hypothetical protein
MSNVSVDMDEVEKLAEDLKRFRSTAFPYAVRNSLNTCAFEGRKIWAGELQRTFILRNTFTTRSLRVVKATGANVEKMAAFLGSIAPYMGKQEKGGTVRGRLFRSKPIPTSVAAGQAQGSRPRTKQVRRPNWLSAIRIGKRRIGKNRKQRNAIAIRQAVASGQRFTFLELENRKGLFRITGTKRITVRMVWDLSKKSVREPAAPTLQRTLKALEPRMLLIHRGAIVDQMKRHRILGYG